MTIAKIVQPIGNRNRLVPERPDPIYVHLFGRGLPSVSHGKEILGGKGANLCEMAAIGLPIPPGFVIDTRVCGMSRDGEDALPSALGRQISEALHDIERLTGKSFGSTVNPLLLSVRSGARVSMPGMMDTVLNLGLNDKTVHGLIAASGDERFAWDSYRRFIQMYADVVLGIESSLFEHALDMAKKSAGAGADSDLCARALGELCAKYQRIVLEKTGMPFPQNPQEQLDRAIEAVFASWDTPRARAYRRLNRIPNEWGTAVTVQSMVFGNMDADSATGVAFTRDPATGARRLYGEYLVNAQGEDVVAGIRTPLPLTSGTGTESSGNSLEDSFAEVFAQLMSALDLLERHYRDAQDVEFTIERGQLFLLQTRSAKRTASAAIRIAVDLVEEGLISKHEAVLRIDPDSIDQLLHPTVDPAAERTCIASGLAASPGAASGRIVFTSRDALEQSGTGRVLLVRKETCPDDVEGMHAAAGFLTATGGLTSHAAVVARGMGRPCVCGVGELEIDERDRKLKVGGHVLEEGDMLTIDGSTGEVLLGETALLPAKLDGGFATLLKWADEIRRLRVRANADTPDDCRKAIEHGAEGIGLCRTEHMFFGNSRILDVQQMILAENEDDRATALTALAGAQRSDFTEIFEVMENRPVTIRLLDPPLHEFLPKTDAEFEALAARFDIPVSLIKERTEAHHESNPMLGHRGCRLGVTHPQIYEMQCRSIFGACADLLSKGAPPPSLEIMVPLVCAREELSFIRAIIDRVAAEEFEKCGRSVDYLVGTMIELPRAALLARDIAECADFFSFGTNDLTQTTLGLSRDDSHRFMQAYEAREIFKTDPFQTLDQRAVGQLIASAVDGGRSIRPFLKLGVCGEHGGDPASIHFFERIGLDYVSASPYRLLAARLAAAQAVAQWRAS